MAEEGKIKDGTDDSGEVEVKRVDKKNGGYAVCVPIGEDSKDSYGFFPGVRD